MTAKYYALLTNLGAAKLANATALGTQLSLTQMAVGDGGGILPTPDPAQTKLIGEKRRASLNALSVDPANTNQIIAEQIIPEDQGGFWIREIGLFDQDNTLIAIANCPETYKPQLQEGSGRTQTVRMILVVNSTDAVTLKIDPSVVLATRKYVDDKVIEVKTYTDEIASALTGKLAKDQNGADIQDKLKFSQNLGLGSASLRTVGINTSQIPDMSFFNGLKDVNGWQALPGGLIIQWGQTPQSSTTPATVNYPIPFPSITLCVIGSIYDDVNPASASIRRKTPSSSTLSSTQFFLNNGTTATSINWIAIGK